MAARVLLVEDDPEYRDWLDRILGERGHRCIAASSIEEALGKFRATKPDLVLLDENLPDGRGSDLCSKLRQIEPQGRTLVAILTGSKRLCNGGDWAISGADTCWTKTFRAERIAALVEALLRRKAWDEGRIRSPLPGLSIDVARRVVSYQGRDSRPLSARELSFLDLIIRQHPGTAVRDAIHSNIFAQSQAEQLDLALNEFIRRLRRKLPSELAAAIVSVHGRGYRLEL